MKWAKQKGHCFVMPVMFFSGVTLNCLWWTWVAQVRALLVTTLLLSDFVHCATFSTAASSAKCKQGCSNMQIRFVDQNSAVFVSAEPRRQEAIQKGPQRFSQRTYTCDFVHISLPVQPHMYLGLAYLGFNMHIAISVNVNSMYRDMLDLITHTSAFGESESRFFLKNGLHSELQNPEDKIIVHLTVL